MAHYPPNEPIQSRARLLGRLIRLLAIFTLLVIVVPSLIGLLKAWRFGLSVPDILVRAAILWAPAVFYLYAVVAIGRVFDAVSAGALFGESVASGLKRAGVALAIGSLFSAVLSPTGLHLLEARGPHIRPDLAYLAVGVIGVSLVLLAGMIRKAGELQQRKDVLESELEGFF